MRSFAAFSFQKRCADPAAAAKTLARSMLGVDMMNIRSSTHAATCTGDWSRAKYLATDRTMEPNARCLLAELTASKAEYVPVYHDAAPRHVEGVQPLTSASIQVSRSAPSCLVERTGRRTARNSPPQPAHNDR